MVPEGSKPGTFPTQGPAMLTLTSHPTEIARWEKPVRYYAEALEIERHPDCPDLDWWANYFLFIMWHESRGKWYAHNTLYDDPWRRASGLMQHLPKYWEGEESGTGVDRVGGTIKALENVGLNKRWMRHKKIRSALPVHNTAGQQRRVGIFNPYANIATAVWLWKQQGWGAWTPSKTHPPENYMTPSAAGNGTFWVKERGRYLHVTLEEA
jgi:hypothetical protein